MNMDEIGSRYADEIVYNRNINGSIKKAQTIKELDRSYDKIDITIHITRYGENLFQLADEYYDDFRLWYLIAEKNPDITNPFNLPIKKELIIPEIE